MRIVTYGAACSLDGFIARRDGAVDWLKFTKDAQQVMQEYWPRIDTVLMGRKTYEVAASMSGGGGSYGKGIRTYVFSRTLRELPGKGAELVREDAGAFVRRMKSEPGKDICVMGGGDFARSLFEAGVIDEVGMNVHPILLGSGIPFFVDPQRQIELELDECRAMGAGCVLLRYRVAAERGPSPSKRRTRSSTKVGGKAQRA